MVQGSCYQGNQRFGSATGIHCACNSLHALSWSKVKMILVWNSSDLDDILI